MTSLELSLVGSTVVANLSAAATGDYYACQVIAAAVISSVTFRSNHQMTGSWTSLTAIPAGTVLYGRFSTLTLASGEVILHKAR